MGPPADVRIIAAREEHAPIVLSLIRALAEYEKLTSQCVVTEADLRTWLFGPRPVAETLLAFADGEPVGYALFFFNFSTFLGRPGIYLEDLFVRPEWRGRGIGKRLLRELAGVAVERGFGRVEWMVLDWNAPSIAFYRSLGAELLEEWSVFRLTGEALTRFGSTAGEPASSA
jgi:GNAT superfamily N-acetyltransferase